MLTPAKKLKSDPDSTSTISVANAKANFSSLITRIEKKHDAVTILRRGVPVAQIVPFPGNPAPKLIGSMAGTGRELGDIVSPSGEEWTVSLDE